MFFLGIFAVIVGAFVGLVLTQSLFKGKDWVPDDSSTTGDLDWRMIQGAGAVVGALCSAIGCVVSALNGYVGLSWAFFLLGGLTFPLGALIVGSVIILCLEPRTAELAMGFWNFINRLSDSIASCWRKREPVANLLGRYVHLVKTHGGESPEAIAFLAENSHNREFIAAAGVMKDLCRSEPVKQTTSAG